MNNTSFRQLLKEQFPPSVVIIHSLMLFLISIVVIPLLLFSDKLDGKEIWFILFLVVYFIFVLFITSIVIYQLYKWNLEKKKLFTRFQKGKTELIENKKVHFDLDVSFTDLRKFAFGNPLNTTQVGFEYCDIIRIEDSLVIFGKGYNKVLPSGKMVSKPFEINYKNKYRTDLNKAYLLKQETKKDKTIFELKVSGLFSEFIFVMTIFDYMEKTAGNKDLS